MRSRSVALLVFLAIGAVHVVIVAWGCTVFAETPVLKTDEGPARWPVAVDPGWPEAPHESLNGMAGGYAMRTAQCYGLRPHPSRSGRPRRFQAYRVELHEFGWPLRALRTLRESTKDVTIDRHAIAVPAFLDPLARSAGRNFPLRPLWPGFIANTLLYAGVAWLLLEGPGRVRRGLRAMNGRCAACGYDLHGASGGCCPECGIETVGP